MTRLSILAGAAILAVTFASASASQAQPRRGPPGPPPGGYGGYGMSVGDFVRAAGQSDQFEVREGNLAAKRARDPQVRAFARMMVRDHTKSTADLRGAVRQDHMPTPNPPPLTRDQLDNINRLERARGRDFDRTYINQQVEAHRQALNLLQSYANNGRDHRPVREAAAQTIPMVQRHLAMAQRLDNRR